MLDSKVDKQIKRYLKSISDKKVKISKINDSCHYYLILEDSTFEIRFADHFSSSGEKADFDIVKVRDLYVIKFMNTIQYSVYEEDALTYIKALFLVGPELAKQLKQSRIETNKALGSLSYYRNKWNKHQEDIKFMDDIWAEKEKVELENKRLVGFKNNYSDLQSKYAKSQNEYNKLKSHYNKLNNKIKQFIKNISDID